MIPNLRDLGGWPTADGGRVRRGNVYRSTALDGLAPGDLAALDALGIRTVVDLRTAAERDARPDRLPTGARLVVADVLADSPSVAPGRMMEAFADPAEVGRALGGGRGVAMFEGAYREFVHLPSAALAYARFLHLVAEPGSLPLLVHCTTGKDRTGWAAAVLLLHLGVSYEDVLADYLRTNVDLAPATQPWIDIFEAAGGDPELLRPLVGVRPSYLASALDEMRRRHGDLDGYLATGLGLEAELLATIRRTLVELPPAVARPATLAGASVETPGEGMP